MEIITLSAVREIAEKYIPASLRWGHMDEPWGPAHEIGHLLVARPSQVKKRDYGLVPWWGRPNTKQKIYEVAASFVHTWILVFCWGGTKHAKTTWNEWVPDFMMEKRWVKLKAPAMGLLKKRGITPAGVQTLKGLEAHCKRAVEVAASF